MVTPISFNGKLFTSKSQKKNPEKINPQDNKNITNNNCSMNKLNASLLGLALIGACTLQSCSQDDFLNQFETEQTTNNGNKDNEKEDTSFRNASTYVKMDKMFRTLGVFDNNIQSIKTTDDITISDSQNDYILVPMEFGKRYLDIVQHDDKKILTIKNDTVQLKQTHIAPERIEESDLQATSKLDSLFIDTKKGDIADRKLYMMNESNDTINEFRYDDGRYVPSSKLTKNPEGGFRQIFPDGTSKDYSSTNTFNLIKRDDNE